MLIFGVLFCWLGPLLTAWEEYPVILQPARAQAGWLYAWLMLFTWIPFQSSALGRRVHAAGLLEFFHARGVSATSLWLQLGAAVLVWVGLVALLATLVCVGPCLPSQADEAWAWTQLVLQFAALYSLVAAPIVLLSVAVATRAGEVIGYVGSVVWLAMGLLAAPLIEPLLTAGESSWRRALWLLFPHAHLADLTPRLVFKMGPLPVADFLASMGCLGLQGAAVIWIGKCLFRIRL
jgi:hypothetical protein